MYKTITLMNPTENKVQELLNEMEEKGWKLISHAIWHRRYYATGANFIFYKS